MANMGDNDDDELYQQQAINKENTIIIDKAATPYISLRQSDSELDVCGYNIGFISLFVAQ